jgi:hypothetical protein
MANTNRVFGFRPDRFLGGSPWNGEQTLYAFSASQANNAYNGDVVQFDSTNRTVALTDVYAPGTPFVQPVVAAVTTTAIRGVIVGFVPQPDFNMSATASLGLMYRVASTARYVWIVDNYNVVFEAQEDGNDYVSAADNMIGKVGDIAYAAGSAITGQSGAQLDSSDFTTGSVRPFKALNYTRRVDNFNFSAADALSYAKVDVQIVNSDLAQGNTGA